MTQRTPSIVLQATCPRRIIAALARHVAQSVGLRTSGQQLTTIFPFWEAAEAAEL